MSAPLWRLPGRSRSVCDRWHSPRRNFHPHLQISFDSCKLRGARRSAIFIFHSPRAQTRKRERENPPPFFPCSRLSRSQQSLLEFSFLPGWRNFWRSDHSIKTSTDGWVGARLWKGDKQTGYRVKKTLNWEANMALLCYNRGCGQNYDPDQNKDGKILCNSSCTSTFKLFSVLFGSVGWF